MKPYAESVVNRVAAIIRAASDRWNPVQWRRFADRIEQGDYTDEAMAERPRP
jgi:hypothetical protein